jgi:hypothetical protein
MVLDTGNVRSICGRIGGRNTSLVPEQVGKFLAGTNKHFCMNTDSNVAEAMQKLKCWLGSQTVPLCNSSKCLFVSSVQ